MRCDVLTKDVVIANAQSSRRTLVLKVLGCVADDATGMKLVMPAN